MHFSEASQNHIASLKSMPRFHFLKHLSDSNWRVCIFSISTFLHFHIFNLYLRSFYYIFHSTCIICIGVYFFKFVYCGENYAYIGLVLYNYFLVQISYLGCALFVSRVHFCTSYENWQIIPIAILENSDFIIEDLFQTIKYEML